MTQTEVRRRVAALLPAPVVEAIRHRRQTGRWTLYRRPVTFSERVHNRKLYARDPLLVRTADKLAVREFVAERVGEEHLVPLLATAERAEQLDWDALPDAFVLKATHGSQMTLIVSDKSTVRREDAVRRANGWLRTSYAALYGEWAYRHIPRRLLVEQFLGEGTEPPHDYKFFVFAGTVRLVHVDMQRFVDHRRDLFTPDWRLLDVSYHYPRSDAPPEPPSQLASMIRIAETLAEPFPFVRVDLYEVGGRVYFGELTHYPGAGIGEFSPPEFDRVLGELWVSPGPVPDRYLAQPRRP